MQSILKFQYYSYQFRFLKLKKGVSMLKLLKNCDVGVDKTYRLQFVFKEEATQ